MEKSYSFSGLIFYVLLLFIGLIGLGPVGAALIDGFSVFFLDHTVLGIIWSNSRILFTVGWTVLIGIPIFIGILVSI
jgi:hypothetical protein